MLDPLVSVCMITYNHEAYIEEAIRGVLLQETDFDFELVIGEDASPDQTREICLRYQNLYPRKIRVLSRPINVGMNANFRETLSECKGKYIALCEGDDFWSDHKKLQRQVEFLESNNDFAISFHRVTVSQEGSTVEELYPSDVPEITGFEDLAFRNFVPTLSCVFRNRGDRDFPDWFRDCPVGDYPLHLLNARHGKLKFFEEVMGHYRVHSRGVWNSIPPEQQVAAWLRVVQICRNHFFPDGVRGFDLQISKAKTNLCFIAFETERYQEFRRRVLELLKAPGRVPWKTTGALLLRLSLTFQPSLARWYRRRSQQRLSDETASL